MYYTVYAHNVTDVKMQKCTAWRAGCFHIDNRVHVYRSSLSHAMQGCTASNCRWVLQIFAGPVR